MHEKQYINSYKVMLFLFIDAFFNGSIFLLEFFSQIHQNLLFYRQYSNPVTVGKFAMFCSFALSVMVYIVTSKYKNLKKLYFAYSNHEMFEKVLFFALSIRV